MKRFSAINCTLCLVLITCTFTANAQITIFDIDLSDMGTGGSLTPDPTLRVFGQITLDSSVTGSSSMVFESDLWFQRNEETPIQLNFQGGSSGVVDNFIFSGDDLFWDSSGSPAGYSWWNSTTEIYFGLYVQIYPGVLVTDERDGSIWIRNDPTPNGTYLGTAVPEPTSAALILLPALFAAICRRRGVFDAPASDR